MPRGAKHLARVLKSHTERRDEYLDPQWESELLEDGVHFSIHAIREELNEPPHDVESAMGLACAFGLANLYLMDEITFHQLNGTCEDRSVCDAIAASWLYPQCLIERDSRGDKAYSEVADSGYNQLLLMLLSIARFEEARQLSSYLFEGQGRRHYFPPDYGYLCHALIALLDGGTVPPCPRGAKVFGKIIGNWDSEGKLAAALGAACDHRLGKCFGAGYEGSDEIHGEWDIFPAEVWAVNAVREELGLPEVEVDHPLCALWDSRPRSGASKLFEVSDVEGLQRAREIVLPIVQEGVEVAIGDRSAVAGVPASDAPREPSAEDLDRVLLDGDEEELADWIDADRCVVVDWKDDVSSIVRSVLYCLPPGELTYDAGGALVLLERGETRRELEPSSSTTAAHGQVLKALAELLHPDFQIRAFELTVGDDTLAFLVKPAEWWAHIHDRGGGRIQELFVDLDDLYTEVT